jgi:small subunit ribosomal protein S7
MRMTLMPNDKEVAGAKPKEPSTELTEVKEAAIVEVPAQAPEQPAPAAEKPAPKRAAARAAKKKPSAEPAEQLLFGKYSFKEVFVDDPSLANQITLNPKAFPSTFGRRKDRVYLATHVNIVERLINKMMRGGTGQRIGGKVIRTKGALQGKKLKVTRIVEAAFDAVNKRTGKNPIQLFVNALENAAPIEDTTRIRYGGISYNVATGISAARRLDVALRNVALAALIGAFKSRKTLADTLAEEIILASNRDPNSYAVKKKVERERIARSAR